MLITTLAAVFLLAFGLLPIANWIPGGHEAPWYASTAAEWVSGSAIVLGGALVLTILSRRLPIWRDGFFAPVIRAAWERPWTFALFVATCAGVTYGVIARHVYSGVPISIDELVQLVQARTFAEGRLWRPADAHPEFYSVLNMVDTNGRYYAQFPPGGPLMMLPGVLIGAPWLVGPVCGAIAVIAFWFLLRVIEPRRGVAVFGTVLFAFAPFMAFMAGSHMNHVPTLMWLVIAMAALARVVTRERPAPWMALLCGLALGATATIRPLDALAFALPAGLWLLVRALRAPVRWLDAIPAGVGVAIPMIAMMIVNARTTGGPLLFGYTVLWGRSHDLGFHRAPWGITHTPARGVELVSLYFLRLEAYLFESSLPSLIPAAAALALARRLSAFDRYLLASSMLVVGAYFAYWHDGFIFGPRFVFVLLPLLVLWTARLPALVRERLAERAGTAESPAASDGASSAGESDDAGEDIAVADQSDPSAVTPAAHHRPLGAVASSSLDEMFASGEAATVGPKSARALYTIDESAPPIAHEFHSSSGEVVTSCARDDAKIEVGGGAPRPRTRPSGEVATASARSGGARVPRAARASSTPPTPSLSTNAIASSPRERVSSPPLVRGVAYAYLVMTGLALVVSIPMRARDYAHGLISMRLNYLGAARAASADKSLILVRESWGTQLMARLWALGVPRSETEALYRAVDACVLEDAIGRMERSGMRDTAAYLALAPLMKDSANVIKSPYSPDGTEHYLPGTSYSPRCLERIADDRAGFTLLAPLLALPWGSNIYARDMHERDAALFARYPDRPVYLMRPVSNEIGAPPRLYPVSRDSAQRVWSAADTTQ